MIYLENLRRVYASQPIQKMGMPTLLVRPEPAAFQCRQDHLMELAEKNTMAGIRELSSKLRGSFMTLAIATDEELKEIALGERQPSKGLRRCNSTSSKLRLYGLGNPSRICPACLQEGLPVTHYCNYALTLTCRAHGLLLVDQCPHCSNDIRYTRPHRERCDFCRKSLTYLAYQRAPSWLKKFRDTFAPWEEDHFCLTRSRSDYAFARLFYSHYERDRQWIDPHPRISKRHLLQLEEITRNYKKLLPTMVKNYMVRRAPLVPDLRDWTAADTKANAIIRDCLFP